MGIDKGMELERNWLELKKNCDYYFSRIVEYPLCPPEHVYFCLTSQCNLRCRMCNVPNSPEHKQDELTTDECKRIIGQIADFKINHLIFSGGEPLLRNDIFDLIAYALSEKIRMVDVITNGSLLDEEAAKLLVRSGLTHITVSLDGLEEAHDFIRGKGSFRKAINSIDLINKYKDGALPTVGINFTIMDCNISQILAIIGLAQEKRCNIVVLQPMLPDNANMQKREKSELWVSQENLSRLEEVIKEVIELKKQARDLSIHVNDKILELIPDYFAFKPLYRDIKCYECLVRIVISYNGDLWTCQGNYGNLKEKPLRECWFSFRAKEIRRQIRHCQSHCLQSCIHLAEMLDVRSEAQKFRQAVNTGEGNGDYQKKLLQSLGRYGFILERRMSKFSKMANKDKMAGDIEELKSELSWISESIYGR